MARKLDDLIIGLQLRTKALEDGLKEAKRQISKHGNDIKNTSKNYDELAVAAGVAFWRIAAAIKTGVEAYNSYNNAMVGLKSITEGTGNQFSKAQKFVENFTKDGLVPASNAAAGLKNLLSHGFSMDQAAEVMERFKDSASFARQGSLSMGQAIQGATEGLKNSMSQMVDNAGVTENLSIMWEKYAQQIGKTVGELTEAEKIQAEHAGVMRATQNQVGDAAKYAKEFSGAQSRAAQETEKLNRAVGGALVPGLSVLLNLFTPIITFLTNLINLNPILSSGLIAMVATLTGVAAATFTVVSAFKALEPAIKAVTLAMAKNPVILAIIVALTVLVGIIAAVSAQFQKAKKVQDEYNTSVEKFNKIKKDGIEKSQVQQFQEEANQIEVLIGQYDKLTAKYKELKTTFGEGTSENTIWMEAANQTGVSTRNLADDFKKFGLVMDLTKGNIDEAKEKLKALREEIVKANMITIQEFNEQGKTIAQKKLAAQETQNLITTYKNATRGSKEWQDAEQKLAGQFPQFSTSSGIKIDAIQAIMTAQDKEIKQEWDDLKAKIEIAKTEITLEVKKKEAILQTMKARQDEIDMARIEENSAHLNFASDMISKKIKEQEASINAQKDALKAFETALNTPIDKITGVNPLKSSTISGDSENKALSDALKMLEYKKHLNQLTLQDEIKTLEQIKAQYVKSADEKMDIEERLYDARKAINEKDLTLQEEALKEKTQATLNWLEDKKTSGDLSLDQEIEAYERLIQEHKSYIDKITDDAKIAADEKKRILQEETDAVREYEQKKYEIKKSYEEKDRQDTVSSINNMNSAITSALRNRYQEQQDMQEEALQNELESLDKWKDESLDRINDVYDQRIKSIEGAATAQEKALKAEIDAIDEQKKQQDRNELDTTELAKIQRLKDKIDYEHNVYNKAQLQKELNQLLQDREKRLYDQQLEDKKDSLEKQIDSIKENADKQKEELEKSKQYEIDRLTEIYNAQKNSLSLQIEDIRAFYAQKLSQAQLEAEAEKMLMQSKQEEILELLKSYGNEYELTGKTLGDRLYDGFKPAIDGIKSLIDSITSSIDAARQEALSVQVMASKIVIPTVSSSNSSANGEAATKKIEINQQLVFNSPNLTPSETARKNLQAGREMGMEWGLG